MICPTPLRASASADAPDADHGHVGSADARRALGAVQPRQAAEAALQIGRFGDGHSERSTRQPWYLSASTAPPKMPATAVKLVRLRLEMPLSP